MTRTLPAAFNPEMVRAILREQSPKRQTRRPMKPQPRRGLLGDGTPIVNCGGTQISDLYHVWESPRGGLIPMTEDCRYRWMAQAPWQIGDILYVRERTRVLGYGGRAAGCGMPNLHVEYEADNTRRYVPWPDRIKPTPLGNCLANGCYQEAARIYLRVTGVRAEVVGDISEADARAEGMTGTAPRDAFRGVWDSIYAAKGIGFDSGAWCWAYDLELLSTTGRPA